MIPKTALAWHELSGYIDQALERDGAARDSWLHELETTAPGVAAQVRDYLREVAELDRRHFLQDPALAQPLPVTLEGQQLGPYTLDRPIGHGGMGTVWLCHRSDGRYEGQAAIKLLNTALVGHPSAGRFAREGSVLARLQHPNIAHLLDAGVAGSGQPYLVLEYIEGERIDLYCTHQSLDLQRRIALFLDVLAAVAHAHSNLIVHRDLKPSNILVTHHGVVKLLDFGVAALLSNDLERVAGGRLTVLGAPGLTPGYAAPEQLCNGPITTATDVYALGVLLFVLLAGRHPLSADDVSLSELMRLTLEAEIPPPSAVAADPRQRRLLEGDLDNIVAMALRQNPAERYTTVELFAQDLRRYLQLQPVLARPQSLRYRAAKFIRRHRASVAAALVIGVTLIGGIAATTLQMFEARRQRDERQFQSERADATNQFLWALMESDSAPGLPPLTLEDRVRRGMQMLETRAEAEPSFAGRMLIQLPQREVKQRNPELTIQIYERALELGRRAEDTLLMATAQCAVVDVLESVGQTEQSARRLAEAKVLMGRDYAATGISGTGCLMAEAKVESRLGNQARAVELLRGVVAEIETGRESCGACYPSVLSLLGQIYIDQGRIGDAIEVALKVGPAYAAMGFGDTMSSLTARQNVATLLSMAGEVRPALAERERINAQLQRFSVPGETFGYTLNHATALLRLGRGSEARQVLGGSVERARAAGNVRMYLALLVNQAWAAMLEREWTAAQSMLDEAQPVAAGGAGSPGLRGRIELLRAQIEHGNGRLQDAQEHIDKALSQMRYGSEQPERALPQVLTFASRVALERGDASQAQKLASDALLLSERVARAPDTSADVGESLLRLARARTAIDEHAAVRPLLERAERCLSNGFGAEHVATLEVRSLLAGNGSKNR